jgi:hypothetical protein
MINIGLFILVWTMPSEKYVYVGNNSMGNEVDGMWFIKNYHGDELNYTEDYNCVNFTNSLLEYADKIGVYCQAVTGCPDENKNSTCHRWVRCDIEPQSFSFVDYRTKYPYQKVI